MRVGRKVLISREAADEWMAQCERAAASVDCDDYPTRDN
jgi:hypothetical protein